MAKRETVFKPGERVVSRFDTHNVVLQSQFDQNGHEWVRVNRENGGEREFYFLDLRPYLPEIHGEWRGPTERKEGK